MSSSHIFSSLPGSVTPEQLCGDVNSGIVTTDWYEPGSYAFEQQPYMTPFPSSTVESQAWPYPRASMPDDSINHYGLGHSPDFQPQQFSNPNRPRSSPSTFGPSPDTLSWTSSAGLGIIFPTASAQPTPPVTSTFHPSVFSNPPDVDYSNSSPPELRQPQPRRPYQPIAPNPIGIAKRRREEEENQLEGRNKKRRRGDSSVNSADLTEEDRFLVHLKEAESLPWKDIANRFQSDKGKIYQVAALQMRYKRLREKFRLWEEQDVRALRQAHEYWERAKWEIISSKMLEFGVNERWPSRLCQRKWQEMVAQAPYSTSSGGMTPVLSYQSSPVDPQMHFGFMPI